jgi:hypothetical protein
MTAEEAARLADPLLGIVGIGVVILLALAAAGYLETSRRGKALTDRLIRRIER